MSGSSPVRSRVLVFMVLMLVWQLVVLGRLVYLKVALSDHYESLAKKQKEDTIPIPAPRGKILDAHLESLAATVSLDSVYAYAPNIKNPDKAADALSRILSIPREEILEKIRGEHLQFRYIKRFLSPDESKAVRDLNLPGVGLLRENRRFYPSGGLAPHVVGLVSLAEGSERGAEGLERLYDATLKGHDGRLFIQKDGLRNVVTTRVMEEERPGQSLVLNIDNQIQYIVQRELRAATLANGAKKGMAVVLEPNTGAVLALANVPDFDPTSLRGVPPRNFRDIAVETYFEPGSTFKVVTAAGALQEKVTHPGEVIYCGNGSISIAGHVIRDHKPFGDLGFKDIIAKSSDVGAIKMGMRLGNERFYNYIRAFGFGVKTGIDLPAELTGFVKRPSAWSAISVGAISMGQEVGVTAVQIARSMAVVANGGYLVRPRVVDRILDSEGRLVQAFPPIRQRVISEETARTMREVLEYTVSSGTAKKASVPGYRICGKTGTAQKFDFSIHRYSSTDYVASFIGFAPSEKPAFVMAIIFDSPREGYHGGEVSAPVFSEIARQILTLKKIRPTGPVVDPTHTLARKAEPSPQDLYDAPAQTVGQAPEEAMAEEEEVRGARVIPIQSAQTCQMPDFRGQSLRSVLDQCGRLGLILQPVGSGIAVSQSPAVGTSLARSGRCVVTFEADPVKAARILDQRERPQPAPTGVSPGHR